MNPFTVVVILGAIATLAMAVGNSKKASADEGDTDEGASVLATPAVVKPVPTSEPSPNPAAANVQAAAPAKATPEVMTAIVNREQTLPSSTPSPFKGANDPVKVSDAAWSKYVGMWKQADPAAVTTDGRYGIFLIGRPTLVDQGYMIKVSKKGQPYKSVWKAPYSAKTFAQNAKLQYDIFVEQAKRHYPAIIAKYGTMLRDDPPATIKLAGGTDVPLTLSGMMAVSRQAALGGLDKWLKQPTTRKGNTTAIFTKFTNLF